MATLTDHLITRYSLQDDYTTKAMRVAASTRTVAQSQDPAIAGFRGIATSAGAASAALGAVGIATAGFVAAAGALAAIEKQIIQAGFGLMQHASGWESLVASLEAVQGSAARAKHELADIRDIAKMPGLGFREAIQGFVNLRRGGLGESMAKDLMREFGNAIALGGFGKQEFERVMRAAMQISVKPFLQGEELLQLTEAGIPAHKIVKDAFGTSDTEELKRRGVTSHEVLRALVLQMAELPRVSGSAKNTFENLADAIDHAKAQAGAALNQAFIPLVQNFADMIDRFSDAGAFKTIAESFANAFDVFAGTIENGTNRFQESFVTFGALMMTGADAIAIINDAFARLWEMMGSAPDWLFRSQIIDLPTLYRQNRRVLEMQMELGDRRAARDGARKSLPDTIIDGQDRLVSAAERTAIAVEKSLQIDMQKHIAGGGDLGRLGVTSVELGGIMGRKSRGGGITINAPGGPAMVMSPAAYIADIIAQYERQRGR